MSAPEATRSFLPRGTRVCGSYVLDRLLRRGALASVYAAHGEGSARGAFVVQMIHGTAAAGASQGTAFTTEMERLRSVRHPAIPAIVAFDLEAEGPVVVTDQAPGRTLREFITRGPPPQTLEIGRLMVEVASVLDDLHRRLPPIVHRRICPENIVVADRGGRVWLEECGLVQALVAAGVVRDQGIAPALPGYLTPDDARQTPGPRGDLFSLATVAFECLTGQLPFKGGSAAALREVILTGPRPRISTLRADLSSELDGILARAWAVEVEDGYASATAFAEDLQRCVRTRLIKFEASSSDLEAGLARPAIRTTTGPDLPSDDDIDRAFDAMQAASGTPVPGAPGAPGSSERVTLAAPPLAPAPPRAPVSRPTLPAGTPDVPGWVEPLTPPPDVAIQALEDPAPVFRPATAPPPLPHPPAEIPAPKPPPTPPQEDPSVIVEALEPAEPSPSEKPPPSRVEDQRTTRVMTRADVLAAMASDGVNPAEISEADIEAVPVTQSDAPPPATSSVNTASSSVPPSLPRHTPLPPPVIPPAPPLPTFALARPRAPIVSSVPPPRPSFPPLPPERRWISPGELSAVVQVARFLGVSILVAALIVAGALVYVARPAPELPLPRPISGDAGGPVNHAPAPRDPIPVGPSHATGPTGTADAAPAAGPTDAAVAGDSGLAEHPSEADIQRVGARLRGTVLDCVMGLDNPRRVRLRVRYEGATGRATGVVIPGLFGEAPMGPCIESAARRIPMPHFGAAEWEASYIFPLP